MIPEVIQDCIAVFLITITAVGSLALIVWAVLYMISLIERKEIQEIEEME